MRVLSPERESIFPNLRTEGYCVSSEEDDDYNCIAYAAGITHRIWWPLLDGDQLEGVDWPAGAPAEETVEAFLAAFGSLGYTRCDGPEVEEGYEKVAIYVLKGVPTHAARQVVPSGVWASKLGTWEDIRHNTLAALEGAEPAYGTAAFFVKRKVQGTFAPACLPGGMSPETPAALGPSEELPQSLPESHP